MSAKKLPVYPQENPQQPVPQQVPLRAVSPEQIFNTSQIAKYPPSNKNKRFAAFIMDSIFSGIVGKLLNVLVLNGLHLKSDGLKTTFSFLLVAAFYWVGLTLIMGATPGKKLMGLRIVNVDQSLDVDFTKLLLRETVGRVISALPLCLGYLWVSWDKERRTFHDMIAKTRVVDFR
ncbi:MAG: hypothetical protein K0R29_25 [Pseudobdellovibrio sp.]|nr:hypothetical protein [Pseudobdellovibrio sp.]